MRPRLDHQRLQKEAARSGLSQRDLAAKLGLSAPHLSMLMSGKRPYPTRRTRRKLTRGLALAFDELFVREPPQPRRETALAAKGKEAPSGSAEWQPRSFARDLRFAWRVLLKRPGLTLVMILTLALGIGANSAIFSVVNSVLINPLPFRDPQRLVLIWTRLTGNNVERDSTSMPNFRDLRDDNTFLEEVAALAYPFGVNLTGDGPPSQIKVASISHGFFSVLGVEPLMGREFTRRDVELLTRARQQRLRLVAPLILSHGLWQSRFGGDPAILGRKVEVNGAPMQVVAVMPPDFRFFRLLRQADLGISVELDAWWPLVTDVPAWPRDLRTIRIVGRLKPQISLAQARQQAQVLSQHLRQTHQVLEQSGFEFELAPLRNDLLEEVQPALTALQGAVLFVLLIACANVANLLLARSAARRREISIRAALGAGRIAILRQMLAESLLLAVAGGAGGLLLAVWGLQGLLYLNQENLPRVEEVSLDGRVLAFTLALCLGSALLFGLLPAMRVSRPDLVSVLRRSGRSGTGTGRGRLQRLLVIAQVALSLILLVGAGLLLRTFESLRSADLGFQPRGVLTLNISLPFGRYTQPRQQADFFHRLEEELERRPQVEAAGSILHIPMSGGWWTGPIWRLQDDPLKPSLSADYRIVTPGYFQAVGARFLAGRTLRGEEYRQALTVAVIDEALARKAWPGSDPREALGRTLSILPEQRPPHANPLQMRVVGVIEHVRNVFPTLEERPTIYFAPELCVFTSFMDVAVKGPPGADLRVAVRQALNQLDPDLGMADVLPLQHYVDRSLTHTRFSLSLIGVFAALAVTLALIGLYGVISCSVAARTQEIGLRMALGAGRARILRQVLSQALAMASAGTLLGVAGALIATQALSASLHGVNPLDPWTFAVMTVGLPAAALAAAFLPARRAVQVEPIQALRAE
ncbi:MAG TPA: ADOP family duplicated permease [Acidobacteriota bacterium]|nr:ADOP family duplicated permease [Acidobacteriota bacterium]